VDEGMAGGHLAVGTLYCHGNGLFGRLQKGTVEAGKGIEALVQLGTVAQIGRNTQIIHKKGLPSKFKLSYIIAHLLADVIRSLENS
jgi:hypothetical protein